MSVTNLDTMERRPTYGGEFSVDTPSYGEARLPHVVDNLKNLVFRGALLAANSLFAPYSQASADVVMYVPDSKLEH